MSGSISQCDEGIFTSSGGENILRQQQGEATCFILNVFITSWC